MSRRFLPKAELQAAEIYTARRGAGIDLLISDDQWPASCKYFNFLLFVSCKLSWCCCRAVFSLSDISTVERFKRLVILATLLPLAPKHIPPPSWLPCSSHELLLAHLPLLM